MDEESIADYIMNTFAGVESTTALGYTLFFYGPDRKLPFATIATADNEGDHASNLDRPGVFRLNVGVSRQTFQSLFGTGKVAIDAYDFTALDTIMPHPDYAPQWWICVLNPGAATFQKLRRCLPRRMNWLSGERADTRPPDYELTERTSCALRSPASLLSGVLWRRCPLVSHNWNARWRLRQTLPVACLRCWSDLHNELDDLPGSGSRTTMRPGAALLGASLHGTGLPIVRARAIHRPGSDRAPRRARAPAPAPGPGVFAPASARSAPRPCRSRSRSAPRAE